MAPLFGRLFLKFWKQRNGQESEKSGGHASGAPVAVPGHGDAAVLSQTGVQARGKSRDSAAPCADKAHPEESERKYADLSPCLHFQRLDDHEPRFRAVGWLAKNQPYKRGKPDSLAFQKLLTLLASPWAPVCIPRRPECPFCPIVSPDHNRKKQPWWAVQRAEVDGLDLVQMHTPETLAHMETYRVVKSGANLPRGTTHLFLPANGYVIVAHAMIAHFIDTHGYAPPPEFWDAVRNCPLTDTDDYLEALVASGPQNRCWSATVWTAGILRDAR